jgi:hypothetical protein
MYKKLLTAVLTSFIAVVLTFTLGLSVNAATTPGITYQQVGNHHYVHFGNNTDAQHITDIASTETFERSGFDQYVNTTSGGILEVDAPIGTTTFVIANASGQIEYSSSINPNATIQFIYGIEYLSEIDIDGNVYTWNLGWYGIFYFVQDKEPILTGETAFVTNIDSPLPEATIRSYISAYDDVDGDITHLIQLVSTDYEEPYSVGQFEIEYSVSDSSGNTASLLVYVLVRDITAPDTNANTIYQVSYTQTFDVAGLGTTIKTEGNDNFYTPEQLTVTVVSNGYTANKSNIGLYTITYSLKDPSGNERLIDVYVEVMDDVDPIVSYNPIIVKPATSNLILADIIEDITATDAISGNVTSSLEIITDGYTGNGNKVGEYDIVFQVSDGAGNITEFTVTVQVMDNVPPVFMVIPGHFIRVEQIVTLTNEEIIDILQRTGQLQIAGPMSWSFISNEYIGNEQFPGLYAMSMRFVSPSGATEVESFVIEVLPSADWDGVVEDAQEWYEEALTWMKENPLYTALAFVGVALSIIGLTVVVTQLTAKHPLTNKTKYSKYQGKR